MNVNELSLNERRTLLFILRPLIRKAFEDEWAADTTREILSSIYQKVMMSDETLIWEETWKVLDDQVKEAILCSKS